MDKIDMLLNALENGADNFSNFEDDSFEDLQNFTPSQRSTINRLRAQQGSRNISNTPDGKGLRVAGLKGNPSKIAAQLDVKVTLINGATSGVVGVAAEYAIFGANDVVTGYNGIITDPTTLLGAYTVKAGISDSAGAKTSGIFDGCTIQTGAAAATAPKVVISSDVVDYPTLLRALVTDMFHVSRIRVSASNTTADGLVSIMEKLKIIDKSIFGKRNEDVISMTSYKMPEQMQAGIIDIPVQFWVDANVSIVSKIYCTSATGAATQQTLTFSFFIDEYYKHTPRSVGR